MKEKVIVWSQWNDLVLPDGVEHCVTNGEYPNETDIKRIQFYVPKYMGGKASVDNLIDFSSLQVIQSLSAGVDDLVALCPTGVTLCNAAGVHDDSTAELAVGLAIASRRGFSGFAKAQLSANWDPQRMPTLTDSKVGIVGYGNIGKRICELLLPFKVEITAFSRSGSDGSLKIEEFDSLLETFDVIILIIPLSDSSKNFMNAARLRKMKNGSSLINVARGPVVDTLALTNELISGRLFAALDVTDPEPLPPNHELWSAPNLIVTPHIGGNSEAFVSRGRKLVQEQIARYLVGEKLLNVIVEN